MPLEEQNVVLTLTLKVFSTIGKVSGTYKARTIAHYKIINPTLLLFSMLRETSANTIRRNKTVCFHTHFLQLFLLPH